MKRITGVGLADVQGVKRGAVGALWHWHTGEPIQIGGLQSSADRAERAGIEAGSKGVDLCCCSGAGMRFLVKFRKVGHMTGVDATARVIERGMKRNEEQGVADRIRFVRADVCASGLADGCADFVWGEDAWCYVEDKGKLIAEAARLVRSGGTIAFTDWVEGPAGMSDGEGERFLRFMKFANVEDIDGYRGLLERAGCKVMLAEDTGRFGPCMDLYLQMLTMQLTYDALRIIGFDTEMMQALSGEMLFVQRLAREGKVAQGVFVAKKEA